MFVPVGWKDYARSKKITMAFFPDEEQLPFLIIGRKNSSACTLGHFLTNHGLLMTNEALIPTRPKCHWPL